MGILDIFHFHKNTESNDKDKTEAVNQNIIPPALSVQIATHNGCVLEDNEDNFYLGGSRTLQSRPERGTDAEPLSGGGNNRADRPQYVGSEICTAPFLAEVCDGMGGEEKGEVASAIAAAHAAELDKKLAAADSPEQITCEINNYVQLANKAICDELNNTSSRRGGSTFALVYIKDSMVYPYSLGDSRIYVYNKGELQQISFDHTLAMKKYLSNIYTLEEALASPDSHKLTLFLGVDYRGAGLRAEAYPPFELQQGMKILLCSDGLYDMCSDAEIAEILSGCSENIADALVNRALANGGIDNITCMVIQ